MLQTKIIMFNNLNTIAIAGYQYKMYILETYETYFQNKNIFEI